MGESLYKKFLDECITDLNLFILRNGVNGLLFEFERWLEDNNLLKEEK